MVSLESSKVNVVNRVQLKSPLQLPFGEDRAYNAAMNRLGVTAILLGAASSSFGTNYDFGQFSIYTNEELWLGAKYTGYPANYLFDGNVRTPWVFKGLVDSKVFRNEFGSRAELGDSIYDVSISFSEERWVDEIRIVPGYANDAASWKRNNRIKRIRVYEGFGQKKLLVEVEIPDEMRWHTIRIPKVRTGAILLRPVEFYRGPDDDVCISEMEFRFGGRRMELDARRASLVNAGGGCCCTQAFWAVNQHGTRLKVFDTGEGFPNACISADGRWIAGTQVSKSNWIDLFVFDSAVGKVAARKSWRAKDMDSVWLDFDRSRLYQGVVGDPFRKLLLDLANRG